MGRRVWSEMWRAVPEGGLGDDGPSGFGPGTFMRKVNLIGSIWVAPPIIQLLPISCVCLLTAPCDSPGMLGEVSFVCWIDTQRYVYQFPGGHYHRYREGGGNWFRVRWHLQSFVAGGMGVKSSGFGRRRGCLVWEQRLLLEHTIKDLTDFVCLDDATGDFIMRKIIFGLMNFITFSEL